MNKHILAFAGRRGSGKSTLTKFLLRNSNELLHSRDSAKSKSFGFSHALKEYLVSALGLDWKILYGSDADKNKPTHIPWERWPVGQRRPASEVMTHRELMEAWASFMRNLDSLAGVRPCIDDIQNGSGLHLELAIIEDLRFQNEVEAVHDRGGKVIRLHRFAGGENVGTDKALLSLTGVDYELHNEEQSLAGTTKELLTVLRGWNIIRPAPAAVA